MSFFHNITKFIIYLIEKPDKAFENVEGFFLLILSNTQVFKKILQQISLFRRQDITAILTKNT